MRNVYKRKLKRTVKRLLRNKTAVLMMGALFFIGAAVVYTGSMQNKRLTADPESYAPLLRLIARAESKDNYNAYFNNPGNTSIKFTDMSIKQVMAWQDEYVAQGNFSSAVGRYQIVNTTLDGLVRRLGIDTSQKFDKTMQDTLAIALLERRGSEKYVNKELTREQFAANLAMEWAALPKVIGENSGDSYYSSDGVNRSLVEVDEVLQAIEPIDAK